MILHGSRSCIQYTHLAHDRYVTQHHDYIQTERSPFTIFTFTTVTVIPRQADVVGRGRGGGMVDEGGCGRGDMEEVVEAGVEVEVVSEKEVEEEAKVEEVEMCALVGRCSSCSAPGCFMSRLDKGAETQRRRQESRGGWGGRLEHVRGSRGRWGKLVVPLKERERQAAM